MAWGFVQSASVASGGASNTSASVTFGANVGSGNKIIVAVSASSGSGATTSTVKDGAGNSWTKIASHILDTNLGEASLWALDVPSGDVGTKPTITATFSGNATASMLIQEVSGLLAGNTTAMVDGTAATNSGTGGTSAASSAYSSNAANEYLLAMYGDDGGPATWTVPSGYTSDTHGVNSNSFADCQLAYKNSSNGSESGTWSLTGTGEDWVTILVAFKLAAVTASGGGTWQQPAPPGQQSPMALARPDWYPSQIQPINVAGTFQLAPLAFSGQAQPVGQGVQSPNNIPPGLQSPQAFDQTNYFPSQIEPIIVQGSFALAPLTFGGNAALSPSQPTPLPLVPPGQISPIALARPDWYPQQIEPITVAGTFSLAPIGFGGSATYSIPPQNNNQSPPPTPPGMASPAALARPDWYPSQIEPITVSGSFALAPITFGGSEFESQSMPNPNTLEPPGLQSPMSLALPDWYPQQIEPITVQGSFALAPLSFGGSASYSLPTQTSMPTPQLIPPGLRSPMALEKITWTQSSNAVAAPIGTGSYALGPIKFNGQVIYTPPPTAFSMPPLTLVQSISNSAASPSTSVTLSFGSNIGATHGIIIAVGCNITLPGPKVSGSPDSFTAVLAIDTCSVLYCSSSVGGYSNITVNVPAPSLQSGIIAFAYEVSGPIVFDKKSSGTTAGAGAWTSSATATTAQAQEFWVGIGSFQSSNPGDTINQSGGGWTDLTEIDSVSASFPANIGALAAISGYQSVSSTGTATYSGNSTIAGTIQSTLEGLVTTFYQSVKAVSASDVGVSSESLVVTKSSTPSASDSGTGTDSIGVGAYTYFPDNPLNAKYEILLNGTWTDISAYVYNRNNVVIGRGRPNEASRLTPASMTLTLNNRGGRFSTLNMMSPYFPFIGRNTQIRVSVKAVADTGPFYPPGGTIGYRFWGEVSEWPPSWDVTGNDVYANISAGGILRRYQQSNAIGSSLYRYYTGLKGSLAPIAYWSCQDSSSSSQFASAESTVPAGTWIGTPQLANSSVFPGSDALPSFNGSSWVFLTGVTGTPVNAGSVSNAVPGTYSWQAPPGITSVSVAGKGAGGGGASPYNAGTAGGDFTFQGDSTTVHAHGGQPGQSDLAVGTGGLGGNGGSGSTDPIHFPGGNGAQGDDNNTNAGPGGSSAGDAAAGTNAVRDGFGAIAPSGGGNGGNAGGGVNSPGQDPASGPGGGGGGGSELLPLGGGAVAIVTGGGGGGGEAAANTNVAVTPTQFYTYVIPAGGQGGPGIAGGNGGNGFAGVGNFSWSGSVSSPVPANYVRFLLQIPASGGIDGAVIAQIKTLGTVALMQVIYHTGGKLELIGYNSGGTQLFDTGAQSFGADGANLIVSIELTISGSNVAYNLTAILVGASSVIASFTGTTAGGVGAVTEIDPNFGGLDTGATVAGHFVVQYNVDALSVVSAAANGHSGELAAARFQRLCTEQGITYAIVGNVSDTPAMGPQVDDTFLNLVQSIEDVDQGQVYEPRDFFGLSYRTRKSLQNQQPLAVLLYSQQQVSPPFQPTVDDQLIRNDITVSRINGSSARAVLASNPTPWQFNTQQIPASNGYFILPATQAVSINIGDTFTDVLNVGQIFAVTAISAPIAGYVNVSFFPNAGTPMVHPDIVTQNNLKLLTKQDPPAGVGDYPYSLSVAVLNDSQLIPLATWILAVGSVNEYRYPQVTVDLTRETNESLFQYVPPLDIGAYMRIPDPPSFLATSPIKQLVWGYTENLNNYTWDFQFNLVPESPYEGGNLPTW